MKISILLLALVAGSFAANIDLAEPEQELQDTLIEDDDTDDEDDFEEDDEHSSLLNSLTFLQGRTGVCAGMAKGSCSKKGGECVAAPFVDNCKAIHGDIGKLKKRSCMSKDCQCCVPPPSCDGKIKKSCSKNGGSCIVQPFKSNCKGGKLDQKSCKGKHCQCCIPETEIKEIEFESIGGEAKSTSAWNEDSQDWIASNAFTGQKHGWHNARGTSLPQNLWYEFDSPMRITWFSFQTRTDGHRLYEGPSSYNFWGSNGDDCSNELTWDILFSDLSDTAFDVDNTAKDAHVNNQNYYKCYGFQVVKSKQGTYSAIANVQMHHSPAGINE